MGSVDRLDALEEHLLKIMAQIMVDRVNKTCPLMVRRSRIIHDIPTLTLA
jgi:hypothetical protein